MNALRRFWARLQILLDRDRFDRELAEEMRFHLELKEADYVASGMSESEARDAAKRKFGNTTRHREESRGVMSFGWLEAAAQDARYALRSLARDKAFGIVAILSLALGIGATTAIFTLVNVTLIKPLPFEAPDRIVLAYQYVTPGPMTQSDTMPWPYVKFEQLRSLVPAFEETGFFAWDDMHLSGEGAAERLKIEAASSGYFSVLGMRPAIGRIFTEADDAPAGTPAIALLSHGLWQRRFGGDPAVVGRTISLKGVSLTVVGVLPAGFSGLTGSVEAWIPMQALPLYGRREAERLTSPMAVSGRVVARVRPGVTQALLDRQMSAAAARLATQFPMGMGRLTNSRWGAGALPLAEARRHPLLEPMLRILSVAVAVVLLIVCANLASLMLARARSRQGELGIRVALGAGRGRLVRQMLTESLLLASIGGAIGTMFAYWGATLLSNLRPDLPSYYLLLRDTDLLEAARLAPDWRVLAFALAVTIVVGLLFGVAPALAASRADVAEALKSGVQRTGQARVRGRGILVVAEMAMATMLLIGAGLMLRSFRQLLRADTGFDSRGVVTMRLEPTDSASATWPRRASVLAAITATPGVRAAALQSCIPLDEGCRLGPVTRIDERSVEVGALPPVEVHVTTPDYFQTMRIPLVAGRLLGERDVGGDSANAMLVNESAARLLWPDRTAVGRRLNVGSIDDTVGIEVVGVVKDVRYGRIDEPAMPAVYYVAAQSRLAGGTNLLVRVDGRAADAIPRLRRVIRAADPAVVVHDARTMDQILRRASSSTRFVTALLVLFAIVAGLLAALGVYGVLAYSVTQRTREFGVRMALGAQPSAVRRLVTRQGAWLTLTGLGVGCGGAYLASGLLQSFLYGVAGTDAATFVSAVVLLALVGALAAFLPARRATAVDPIVALRAE